MLCDYCREVEGDPTLTKTTPLYRQTGQQTSGVPLLLSSTTSYFIRGADLEVYCCRACRRRNQRSAHLNLLVGSVALGPPLAVWVLVSGGWAWITLAACVVVGVGFSLAASRNDPDTYDEHADSTKLSKRQADGWRTSAQIGGVPQPTGGVRPQR